MGDSVDVSVVVPAKDERDNLAPLIGEIDAALGGKYDYELIYVDDGSEDDSFAVLCELKARFASLRVVRHVRAVGQSMAVLSGVRHGRGDWLVVLDGDGQNDPADIPPCWRRPSAVSRRTGIRSGSSATGLLAGMTG